MLSGNLNTFWHDNKGTIVVTSAAIVKTLLDNSWIFTSLPLPGQDASYPVSKFFYLLSQAMTAGVMWGAVGKGLDYARAIHESKTTETSGLVQSRI